jgi:heme exporter protein D
MRNLDFSSWQGLLSTLFGLAVITAIAVGLRLVLLQTVQRRRERQNRQINERLRTLIAAYKTLGGSFTGDLAVDPAHRHDVERAGMIGGEKSAGEGSELRPSDLLPGSDRARRIRDAVEAALSDILLLGTEEQVRLAAAAATEMVSGRTIHTAELVISLRSFIREVLDLDRVPQDLSIPYQGPARPAASGIKEEGRGRDKSGRGDDKGSAGGMATGGGAGISDDSGGDPNDHEPVHRDY